MIVLDASALLSLLQGEAGSDRVSAALDEAVMSTANLAEVLGKAADRHLDVSDQRRVIGELGITYVDVSADDATTASALRALDMTNGKPVLSLGDRLCLALATRMEAPVLTADRAWSTVAHGLEVQQIR